MLQPIGSTRINPILTSEMAFFGTKCQVVFFDEDKVDYMASFLRMTKKIMLRRQKIKC